MKIIYENVKYLNIGLTIIFTISVVSSHLSQFRKTSACCAFTVLI